MTLGRREVYGADAGLIDGDEFAGLNFADELGAADIERTGFGGHDPALGQAAKDKRAHAVRVAGGVHGVPIGKGQAESALNAREQIAGGVEDGGVFIHAVGKQHGQAHGVRNGFLVRLDEAALHGLLAQLQVVDQIAVVPKGNVYPGGGGRKHGLHVGPFLAAGGGIARVPHRYVSLEGRQGGFIKDIGHQAHVFEYDDAVIIAHRDAGGLLAAVLQGEEPKVG